MAKTNKSILKRMKMTKSGKIMHAGSGINHFQAKKSRSSQLRKKRLGETPNSTKWLIQSYLIH